MIGTEQYEELHCWND